MSFRNSFKISALYKQVGGVGLIILGSSGLLFSSLFAIIAFAKGFAPHGIVASLVAMSAVAVIMKGMQLFSEMDNNAEKLRKLKNAKKLRYQSSGGTNSDISESDTKLRSEHAEEMEGNGDNASAQQQYEQQPLPEEDKATAALVQKIEVNPALDPINKDDVIQSQMAEVTVAEVVTVPEKSPADATPIFPVTKKMALFQVNPIGAAPLEKITPNEQREILFKQTPIMPTVSADTQSLKTEIKTTVEEKRSELKVEDTFSKAKSASSENSTITISATKPLQFVEVLIKVVSKVIEGIKQLMGFSSNQANDAGLTKQSASTPALKTISHTPSPS